MNSKERWDSIYQSKADEDLSWTQTEPALSLKLIGEVCSSGRVINVGGGTSVLAERLLDRGYTVTVLDISEAALGRARERLRDRASLIHWIAADQATSCGVEIRFGDSVQHLPDGGIVAHGPRGSDVIAVGYVFETDMADAAFGAVCDQLAPKGYSYLLVSKGQATVASTIFHDYHNEKRYLESTVEFFRKNAGLRMKHERRFGGVGNFLVPRTARKGNILFAGEAAGFQDALWGFGMRYAMLSGNLAARAVLGDAPKRYDRLWNERLGGTLRAGFVNRYAIDKLGDAGYSKLLVLLDHSPSIRGWLRSHYDLTLWKRLMYPLAHRAVRASRKENACVMEGCDCTWCRCQHATAGRGRPKVR